MSAQQPVAPLADRKAWEAEEPGVYVWEVVGDGVWRFDDEDSAHDFVRAWDLRGDVEVTTVEATAASRVSRAVAVGRRAA